MRRIVVAENEAFLARMLRIALVRAGYRVQVAADTETAWELLSADPPDALIVSASLPERSGPGLCERMQMQMPDRDLPTIIMSGRTDIDVRRLAEQFSRTVVLDKPVSVRNLLSQLDTFSAGDSMVDTLVGEGTLR